MTTTRAVVVGARARGPGGGPGAEAVEGYQTIVLERQGELGGKASERLEGGYRWDEGPSIVVMPWVYRTLFQASGLDPDKLSADEAARPGVPDRALGRPEARHPRRSAAGLRDAFAAINPADGPALDKFLDKMDRFARLIAHSFCDRISRKLGPGDAVPVDGLRRLDLAGQGVRQGDRRAFPVAGDPRAALTASPPTRASTPSTPRPRWPSSPGRSSEKGSGIPSSGGIAAIPQERSRRACRRRPGSTSTRGSRSRPSSSIARGT